MGNALRGATASLLRDAEAEEKLLSFVCLSLCPLTVLPCLPFLYPGTRKQGEDGKEACIREMKRHAENSRDRKSYIYLYKEIMGKKNDRSLPHVSDILLDDFISSHLFTLIVE